MSVGPDTAKEIQGVRQELQAKAAQFLSVVQTIENIFSPYYLSNSSGALDSAFFDGYKSYCIHLRDNAIQRIGLEYEEVSRVLSDNTYKIDELGESKKRFTNRLIIFFESSDGLDRETILSSLNLSLKSEKNDGAREFLKKLYQQLNGYQLLEQTDREYNPKIDILLELYFIGEVIYGGMEPFPLLSKKYFTTSHFRRILDTGRKTVKTKVRRSISFIGAKDQSIELAVAPQIDLDVDEKPVLSAEDVYAAIQIDETLFSPREYNHEVVKKFEELYKIEQAVFRRLIDISEELSLIKEHLKLNESEVKCISGFLIKLKPFLLIQEAICSRAQKNNVIIANMSHENDNSFELIDLFLDIYKETCLQKQAELSEILMRSLEEIDKILIKNEIDCKRIADKIPVIVKQYHCALEAIFVQIPTRRKAHSEYILKNFNYGVSRKLEEIKTCCRQMSYIPVRDILYRDLKIIGYIRPPELRDLIDRLKLNVNDTVANVIVREELNDVLKKSFLARMQENNNMVQKLKFFQDIYILINPQRTEPLRLEELMLLRHYFNEDNLLDLPLDALNVVNKAFHLKERYSETIIKHIITVLMPILSLVHHDLEEALREFQFSYDIIEILLDVPTIKDKLNGKKAIWALNRTDIQSLSPFWREIFTNENSALRKFLKEKKDRLISSRDIPSEFIVTISMFLNVDVAHKRKPHNSGSSQYERMKDEFKAQMGVIEGKEFKNYKDMNQVIDPIMMLLIQEEFYNLVRLFSEDGTLHQYFMEQLVTVQQEIFEAVFNAFKITKVYEELIELFNDDPCDQHFIGSENEKMAPRTPQNIIESREFYNKVQEGLSGPIREELYQKIKSVENVSFTTIRNSVVLILLKKEFSRQIKFLKEENIFSDAMLTQLLKKEDEILMPVLHRILKKKKPELFMGGYARALLEMPYYLVEALSDSFSEHMLETRTVFSSEFILQLSQSNVTLDLISFRELIKILQKEYNIKNRTFFSRIENQTSIFRLLNMVHDKFDNQIYHHLGDRICELRDDKPKTTGMSISLVPETPVKQKIGKGNRPNVLSIGAVDKIFEEDLSVEPSSSMKASGNEKTQDPYLLSMRERVIQRQQVKKPVMSQADEERKCDHSLESLFQSKESTVLRNMVDNLKEEIALDPGEDWRFEESPHMTKIYDKKTLVFIAAEKEASKPPVSQKPVSSISVEDIYVEVHRHNEADVAKAVNAMAKTMQTMRKPKLEIEVVTSDPNPQEIIKQYVCLALEKDLFPEVILNGDKIPPQTVYKGLLENAPRLVEKYGEECGLDTTELERLREQDRKKRISTNISTSNHGFLTRKLSQKCAPKKMINQSVSPHSISSR